MKRIISIFLMIALLAPYVAVETSKAEKIRVALLDSGVDLDDDIECEEQEDFIDNTGEETNFLMGDSNGHGTAVAGIICARKSEDRICGMAANVELYSAKILDEQNEQRREIMDHKCVFFCVQESLVGFLHFLI